jgi:hypothetical protein
MPAPIWPGCSCSKTGKTHHLLVALFIVALPVIADLVPDYLKAIPQNPFTGMNLVLTP